MAARKPKLALLINLIAPYRVPVYARLAESFELLVLHGHMEANRAWKQMRVPGAGIQQAWGWQVKLPIRKSGKVFDYRFLHFEPGYFTALLRFRPEAIISNELGFRTLLAIVYGFLFRVPVWVWWGGTLHTERALDPARRLLRRVAAWAVRHWISYGETSTEYLRSLKVPRSRILQIQNCVDESWYLRPVPPALDLHPKPVVLHVGQLIARKGVAELLQAAARLQAEGAEFSLVMVGGGPDLGELEQFAARLGLRNLHMYPPQPAESLAAFYRSGDVLVFPTMQDVWGLVANEAALSGLPVLCSKYAGCAPELFSSECIFDPADADAFVAALRRAVNGKLPKAAREKLKSSREVADMIIAEIRSALCVEAETGANRQEREKAQECD
jgi:glycosyltransferase involved in cell wall biosynthesis